MEWISVNDKLPKLIKETSYGKRSNPVIGYFGSELVETVVFYENYEIEESHFYYLSDGGMTDNVTHWAPMPPPPTEED